MKKRVFPAQLPKYSIIVLFLIYCIIKNITFGDICNAACIHCICVLTILTEFLVAAPTVVVTAASPQTVGSSLTLTCSVTAVQGVTAMANIAWTANGVVLQMTTDRIDNVPVYMNNYTIPTLSTADDGRMYRCEVVVLNTSPSAMASDVVTLDVMGEYVYVILYFV